MRSLHIPLVYKRYADLRLTQNHERDVVRFDLDEEILRNGFFELPRKMLMELFG